MVDYKKTPFIISKWAIIAPTETMYPIISYTTHNEPTRSATYQSRVAAATLCSLPFHKFAFPVYTHQRTASATHEHHIPLSRPMLWATARARVSSYRGIIIVIILPSRRRGARALATIFVWRVQHVENYTEHALHEEERRGSAPPSNDGYGTAHHVGRRRDSALTLATTRPYMFLHDARVTPMRGDLETYVLYI